MRVQFFATCLVDTFYPQTGLDTIKVLEHFGVEVVYPPKQTCCGKPPESAGYMREATKAAEHFLSEFEGEDPIVIPSGSCASMVKNHYPGLFRHVPRMKEKAESVAARTYELTQFLVNVLKVDPTEFSWKGRITYHASCQLTRELGVTREPLFLLESLRGADFIPLPFSDRCCGFGGVFMARQPEISMALADGKSRCHIVYRG